MDTIRSSEDASDDETRVPTDAEVTAGIARCADQATDASPPTARRLEPETRAAAPPVAAAPPPAEVETPKKLRAKPGMIAAMFVVALVGIGLILYAWRLGPFASTVVSTEDSYVRGQITVMAPQVNGYVTDVLVRDFQRVSAGDPLVKIDDRIYRQQLEQAEAQRAVAEANLQNADQTTAQNEAEIGARKADLFQAQSELARAQAESERARSLTARGLKPESETDQVFATLRTAEAGIRRAEAAINIAEQTLRSTQVSKRGLEANVRTAQAQVDLARINLDNTIVHSPRDGQVGEASVRPGQYVTAGSQLMFLVPDTLWVIANYKETFTRYVKIGQPARLSVDALGGTVFRGKVVEIAPATGSEFSVLRPDNASGNFTKVVQRLPIRIALEPNQPGADRLRPGLSVVAHVDTSNAAPERPAWVRAIRELPGMRSLVGE